MWWVYRMFGARAAWRGTFGGVERQRTGKESESGSAGMRRASSEVKERRQQRRLTQAAEEVRDSSGSRWTIVAYVLLCGSSHLRTAGAAHEAANPTDCCLVSMTGALEVDSAWTRSWPTRYSNAPRVQEGFDRTVCRHVMYKLEPQNGPGLFR